MGVIAASFSATASPTQPPAPAPDGDVIPVACAVFLHDDNSIEVDGCSGGDAETRFDQRRIATMTVNVPRSLLSPTVLPDVTARS